jgi:hypothetical protein
MQFFYYFGNNAYKSCHSRDGGNPEFINSTGFRVALCLPGMTKSNCDTVSQARAFEQFRNGALRNCKQAMIRTLRLNYKFEPSK